MAHAVSVRAVSVKALISAILVCGVSGCGAGALDFFGNDDPQLPGHLALSGSPDVVWSSDAGRGGARRVIAGPVVSNGRIFTLDGDAQISAFDAITGDEIWEIDITPEGENASDGFGGGLAISGNRLFATSGFGQLQALSTATGETLWNSPLGSPSRAAPVVSNGRVFAVTRENRFVGFNADDGELLWETQGLEQRTGILGGGAPAATDDIVIAPFSSGEIAAFLGVSGRIIWDDDLTSVRGRGGLAAFNDIAGDPVIADGFVYAASQSGRLAAIDIEEGERLWTRNIGGTNAPYVAGNALFIVDTSGNAIALERETGQTLWVQELGAFERPERRSGPVIWSGPVVAGGRVILTSSSRRLVSLDASSGAIIYELRLPDGVTTPPAVANETLYLLTDRARLIALR